MPRAMGPGLGRKRRDALGVRFAARRRAAVVCAFLGFTLALAARPELFWDMLRHAAGASSSPDHGLGAEVLNRTAAAAHAQGRLEESARLYGLLLAQYPQHPLAENALAERVQALVALGENEAAQAALWELQVRSPRSDALSEALLDMAFAQAQRGQLQQAVRSYTDVVAFVTQQDEAAPQRDAGVPLTARLRRAEHGEKSRRTARRTEMERIARFNLAVCYDLGGNRAAALRAYEHFLRRYPTDARVAEAAFRMGVMARGMGQQEDAVRHFARVWQTEGAAVPFRAASIYLAGLDLEALRRRDEALDTYRLAAAIETREDPCRLAALGRLALLLRDREPLHALEIYRDVAAHSTNVVERALAQQRLLSLQQEATVAVAR